MVEFGKFMTGLGQDVVAVSPSTIFLDHDKNVENGQWENEEHLPPLNLALLLTHAFLKKGIRGSTLDMERQHLSVQEVAQVLNGSPTSNVAISVTSPSRKVSLAIARELDKDKTLIIGGPHATAMPEQTVREFSSVHEKTVVIPGQTGQVERSFTSLLDGELRHTVPGLLWMMDQVVHRSAPVQEKIHFSKLPQIDRRFIDPVYLNYRGLRETTAVSSVFCPWNCNFCHGAHDNSGFVTESRTPPQVALEVAQLVKELNVESLRFVDDLFLMNWRRLEKIFAEMDKINTSQCALRANGHILTSHRMPDWQLDSLVDRKLTEIAFGIESGVPRILREMNKPHTNKQTREVVERLAKRRLFSKGWFILGYFGETKEETHLSVNLMKELRQRSDGLFRAHGFGFRVYPGTKDWDKAIAMGYQAEDLLDISFTGAQARASYMAISKAKFAEYNSADINQIIADFDQWQLEN